MDILLDTHILLWHLTDNPKLSNEKSDLIESSENQIFISIASLWEIAIKNSIGKLKISKPIHEFVPREINILEITIHHIEKVIDMPFHHRDPFDRMIIAQAISENFKIMTDDGNFKYYDIEQI